MVRVHDYCSHFFFCIFAYVIWLVVNNISPSLCAAKVLVYLNLKSNFISKYLIQKKTRSKLWGTGNLL